MKNHITVQIIMDLNIMAQSVREHGCTDAKVKKKRGVEMDNKDQV